jgi:hypothetical protein
MTDHKKINAMLRRTQFSEVMNYIWKISSGKMTKEMQKHLLSEKCSVEATTGKGKKETRELVLFTVDIDEAAHEIGIGTGMVSQYLQRFAEMEIIHMIADGRGKAKHPTVYACGTWVDTKKEGIKNRAGFMKNTSEWKEKLATFATRKKPQ